VNTMTEGRERRNTMTCPHAIALLCSRTKIVRPPSSAISCHSFNPSTEFRRTTPSSRHHGVGNQQTQLDANRQQDRNRTDRKAMPGTVNQRPPAGPQEGRMDPRGGTDDRHHVQKHGTRVSILPFRSARIGLKRTPPACQSFVCWFVPAVL